MHKRDSHMKHIYYSVGCSLLFVFGLLLFFYQESWFIITCPLIHEETYNPLYHQNTSYKTITLYAWSQNKYKKETTEIIHSDNTTQNIKLLLNSWLQFVDDEHITDKETQIVSVSLSPSKQEAFICLNQYPFEKDWSTYRKLMWIESLLKTLRDNKIHISGIRLLVLHQPLIDDHLNFECSWPISGYLQ